MRLWVFWALAAWRGGCANGWGVCWSGGRFSHTRRRCASQPPQPRDARALGCRSASVLVDPAESDPACPSMRIAFNSARKNFLARTPGPDSNLSKSVVLWLWGGPGPFSTIFGSACWVVRGAGWLGGCVGGKVGGEGGAGRYGARWAGGWVSSTPLCLDGALLSSLVGNALHTRPGLTLVPGAPGLPSPGALVGSTHPGSQALTFHQLKFDGSGPTPTRLLPRLEHFTTRSLFVTALVFRELEGSGCFLLKSLCGASERRCNDLPENRELRGYVPRCLGYFLVEAHSGPLLLMRDSCRAGPRSIRPTVLRFQVLGALAAQISALSLGTRVLLDQAVG